MVQIKEYEVEIKSLQRRIGLNDSLKNNSSQNPDIFEKQSTLNPFI
jgi:hypothetical protein